MAKTKKMAVGGVGAMPTATAATPMLNPGGRTMPTQSQANFGPGGVPPGIARAAEASGRGLSGLANGRFAPPPVAPAAPVAAPAAMKKGGKVGSASKRADGIAQRGKTRGKMV